MKLLAVETTGVTGSLAVAEILGSEYRILSTRRWQKKSSHSEVITLECEAAIQESGLTLEAISHFACDAGPGSFTGIRVGLNHVRTLAYSLDRRVRLFQSLEVLAFEHLQLGESRVVAIPSLREFFYGGIFRRFKGGIEILHPVQGLVRTELEELKTKTGDDVLILTGHEPRVESLVELVSLSPDEARFIPWQSVKPLYIRRSEAEEKEVEKLRKCLLKPV